MTSGEAPDLYTIAQRRIEELIAGTTDLDAIFSGVCRILHETIPTYTWVGIYLVEGSDLALAAWTGPAATAHVRIPIGEGICGYAAAHAESIIIPDVSEDPRYLECFADTRSEIVVPIMLGQEVLGEIDVDSNVPNVFGVADEDLLTATAAELVRAIVQARDAGTGNEA
jgi:L-methionine (R)-S-oxide reductase